MAKNNTYSQEQIEWLKENSSLHSNLSKEFNKVFNENKTEHAIRQICFRNNIERYKKQNDWLRKNASKYYIEELLDKFNKKFYNFNMDIEALYKRLKNNNIEYKQHIILNKKEIEWLKNNSKNKTLVQIEKEFNEKFGKDTTSLKYMINKLNIVRFSKEFGKDRKQTRTCSKYVYERVDNIVGGELYETFKSNYRKKSHIMYEKYHNVIVKDEEQCVIHLDNNYNNFEKDNLYLIDKKAYRTYLSSGYKNEILETKLNALKVSEILALTKE